MSTSGTSYGLVTPARDESASLKRLAACITAQTRLPRAWVIVDNGSTDETLEVARSLAREHGWIRAVGIRGTPQAKPGAPVVQAFHEGLRHLPDSLDVIVKLDADVTMEADYFERLTAAFASDPRLGIASGVCFERHDGSWAPTHVTRDHPRGATRAYRSECLDQILPLEVGMGWDTIDELRAQLAGWRTRIIPDLRFKHHRFVGERDGSASARWESQGRLAHYLGYRPLYLLLRTLHHARRRPEALGILSGYISAVLARAPRYPDQRVRRQLRREQRLRMLPRRAREALGHRVAR